MYELADGAEVRTVVPSPSGDTAAIFQTRREGGTIKVGREGAAYAWRVLLAGFGRVAAVEGADSVERTDLGTLITLAANTDSLRVSLVG